MKIFMKLIYPQMTKTYRISRYNCDDIRPHFRQQLLKESKASQLLQMEDNRRLKEMAKDNEKMWHDVAERMNYEQKMREQCEEQLRSERESCIIQTLHSQVQEKQTKSLEKFKQQAEEQRLNEIKLNELKESERKQILEAAEKKRHLREDLEVLEAFATLFKICNTRKYEFIDQTENPFNLTQKQKEYNKLKKERYEFLEFESAKRQAELIQKELEHEKKHLIKGKVTDIHDLHH